MDGTRGAKGSINDRLISVLYRNRYNKYKLSKEQYTLNQKKSQKDYINQMKYLSYTSSTNSLDDKDSNKLQELNIKNLKFNLESVCNISNEVIDKPNKEIKKDEKLIVKKINIKSNILFYEKITEEEEKYDEIVDLCIEEKKVDNEIIIIKELDNFIDKSKEELNIIEEDLISLKEKNELAITEEEINKVVEEYNILKLKIKKFMEKYSTIKNKYNFEDYEKLENLVLLNTTIEYKDIANILEIEMLVSCCKDKVDNLSSTLEIYEMTNKIKNPIEAKKTDISRRDKEFKTDIVDVDSLEAVMYMLNDEAIYQQKMINEIVKKMYNVKDVVEVTDTIVVNTNNILGSYLKIAAGILTVPFTNSRILPKMLGMNLINKGVKELNSTITIDRNKKEIIYYDLEKEIFDSKSCLKSTENILDDAFDQILLLEYNFDTKFKSAVGKIPEYDIAKDRITKLKNCLGEKKQELNAMNKSLKKQETLNRKKLIK